MAEFTIDENSLPDLSGKIAIVTGGSAGIGLSTTRLLLDKGAIVHAIDLNAPDADTTDEARDWEEWGPDFHFHRTDVRDWPALRAVFAAVGRVDLVFANAGEVDAYGLENLLQDVGVAADDKLREANFDAIDLNVRAVVNTVRLGHHAMKKHGVHGGIVVTGSTAMYIPDRYVPLSSCAWGAQLNLVRTMKDVLARDSITINAVAPFVAVSSQVPLEVALGCSERDIPVSEGRDVARALVFSAVGTENGNDVLPLLTSKTPTVAAKSKTGDRWNGRVIFVMGNRYCEMEGQLEQNMTKLLPEEFRTAVVAQRRLTEEWAMDT